MSDQPVNWGILGAANFAAEHMGPAIHQATGARLAALATSSDEKADRFRAFCPDLKVHNDYDALLADPAIEAVYIPLPNHLHVEWTKKALAAGKHVLCEKPVSMRADQVDELIAARDLSGKMAAEAYMIVHHPQWQRLRALLNDGAIGTLRHVDVAFSFNLPINDNIRNRPETGGGSLPDIGVYTFGSTRFATGQEPLEILSAKVDFENGVDTFALVTAQFDSFTYSGYTGIRLANRQEVAYHGDKGVLRLTAPFNAQVFGDVSLVLHRPGKDEVVERFNNARQYPLQVQAFGQSIRQGTPYPWRLEDSKGTQRMIDMVLEKARG